MSARSKARKRALDVLYESELRGSDAVETLAERLAQSDPPIPEYAVELVEGVVAHQREIDAVLSALSLDWPLDRMPAVDRNVLRIGAYELLFRAAEVPEGVAISEAVSLATALSTDESPKFVNGVLARVAADRASFATASAAAAPPDEPADATGE